MTNSTRRAIVGGLIPLAAFVGLAITLSDTDTLPDPVATHFTPGGTPDGSMSITNFTLFVTGLTMIGILVSGLAVWWPKPLPATVVPTAVFSGTFFSLLGVGIAVWTVRTQDGLANWTQAEGPGYSMAIIIVAGLAVSLWAAVLASQLPTSAPKVLATTAVTAAAIPADGDLVWLVAMRQHFFQFLGAAVIALGVVLTFVTFWWIGLILLIGGAISLTVASASVQADASGLTVAYGPWRRPRQHFPLGEIDTIEVIQVRPMEWGGWGYRGGMRIFGRAGVIFRGGDALSITRTNGRQFVITVDDASGAASVLLGHQNQQS